MAGAGREHVPGDGIVGLLVQPLLEELDRLVDLAERAVGEREESPRLGILRPERDDPGEADGRLVRPFLAVQQDTQVVVRVGVLGIQVNRSSICLLRLHHPSLRPEHHTEIVVRVGVLRIERDRALVRAGRPVQLESILQHDAQVAVPVRPLGLELEAPLDQRDRLLALRLLVGEHPEKCRASAQSGATSRMPR